VDRPAPARDERGTQSYDEIDYKMACAIVLAREQMVCMTGGRRRCDFLVSIPCSVMCPSLNVSVAGHRDV